MGQINLNNFKVITDKLNTFFVDNKFMVASEIPTTGDFKVGDIIINNGPTNVDEPMWICIEAGNPGTWTVFNSGGGSAGGGKLTTARNRVVLDGESKSEVSIGVSGFNKASDVLMVFINSRFMTEGVDYEINTDSTKIVAIGEVWNEELASEFEIEMVVFKMMGEEGVVSSVNEIVKLKNTVIVNESVNEVEIGIDGFNEGDDLTVYRNSVYMIEGIDYEVQGSKIVSLKGAWNTEGGSDYKFTFEVLKAVAKVNPDAVVGMEHLTEDVKEAIEAAGNIDLSGYATNDSLDELNREIDYRKQSTTDEKLVTNDKSIVGAINELFQDVDSGKGIIADAIDDRNITKDSTFAAMGEAIEGIHADREEDRQKLIEILQGSNMDLTGNESMDTLLNLIDMSNLDLSKVVQIACGYACTMLLYNDGTLWACGTDAKGGLGLGSTSNKLSFTQVTDVGNDVKQVSCCNFKVQENGYCFAYIVKNDGSLWSCGSNYFGQLGLGTNDSNMHSTFTQVTTNINNDVKQVSCGGAYVMIVKNDGSLWGCGLNNTNQMGIGGGIGLTNFKTTFTQVTTNINNDVKEVICGDYHTFIIKNDGSVWSCGYNTYGQLGNGQGGPNVYSSSFTKINVNNVKQIACGNQHTFIIKNDGSVWSCGLNDIGQLGLGTIDTKVHSTFTQVTTNVNNDVKQVSCGQYCAFIIKNDGSLWSCGLNNYGQLGLGNTTSQKTFTQVITNINDNVEQVASAGYSTGNDTCGHVVILKNDGTVWSCGYNASGQLGLGNTTNQNTFMSVNQTEALQTQVTALQLEATTNRGNLATVLTDEGVELTGDETLAELILKVNDIDTMAFPEWYNQGIYIAGPSIPISYIYGRDMCCAAYKDNKIILAGGFYESGNNYSSDSAMKYCYIFDDTNGTWEQKADMLINSGSLAAAIIDDSFYVINGVYSTKFQCYDIITDTWSYKAEMPSYSSEMNVVAHNNKLYTMGGWSSDPNNGAPQKHNFCYDRLTDTWSYKAEMPYGRRAMGLAIYNDEIYMAGGYYFSNGYKAATTFSKYTIESDSYTELPSMPYETSITTLAFNLGVYIYVHYANYMMAYNILNDSWDNRLSCPTNVTHRTGCVLDDRIHIMCGVNSVAHDVFIETRDTRK